MGAMSTPAPLSAQSGLHGYTAAMISLLLTVLASNPAHAFGGVLVGSEGDVLLSKHSQIVVARNGNQTTLTLAPGYVGDASRLAFIVPLPDVIDASAVTTPDPGLLDRLDANAAPRLVKHDCGDFYYVGDSLRTDGCGCGPGEVVQTRVQLDVPLPPQQVSAIHFPYQATSATWTVNTLTEVESDDVTGYLDALGFSLAQETIETLTALSTDSPGFVVAQIDLGSAPEAQVLLPPLQISYEAFTFQLPLTLGSANADGTQELLIYGIGAFDEGQLGIGNLNQHELGSENDCLVAEEDAAQLTSFYEDTLDSLLQTGPSWVTEFAFGRGECSCEESDYLSDEDVAAMGFAGVADDAFLTRLRVRYIPEDLTDELVLYFSGTTDFEHTRFLYAEPGMEEFFDLCGMPPATDPEVCDNVDVASSTDDDEEADSDASTGALGGLLLLGLLGWSRRRFS
jgi:MYXO-CTERM domain-containing protein